MKPPDTGREQRWRDADAAVAAWFAARPKGQPATHEDDLAVGNLIKVAVAAKDEWVGRRSE